MKTSERRHWEKFWGAERDPDEIYPDSPALMDRLEADGIAPGTRVLEVGAGSGRDAVALARAGAHVTVVDYAENALEHVRVNAERAGVRVNRLRADGQCTPFPDGAFDLVIHQGLLEHFRDPLPLLGDNLRVLAPGGRLYCAVPQTFHLYTVFKHALIAADRWFAGWETEFTPAGLDRVVERAGFCAVGRFGSWMAPSLGYRVVRGGLNVCGLRLPMYPRGPRVLARLRRRFSEHMGSKPGAAWTFLVVGVVAEKP